MQFFRDLLKKTCVLSVFLFLSFPIYAEWDSECIQKGSKALLSNDVQFQKLKSDVTAFLKNSWCSDEKATLLMELIRLQKPSVCVEIGVFTGSSLLPIAATLKYLGTGKVYGIDPWTAQEAIKHCPPENPNTKWWASLDMNQVFSQFNSMKNQWGLNSNTIVVRQTSANAKASIPNIDFLHIDGNYSEISSLEDVAMYVPKVKKGGYILYSNIGWIIEGKIPRMKAFQKLLDSCVIIAQIDTRNSFLLKKIYD